MNCCILLKNLGSIWFKVWDSSSHSLETFFNAVIPKRDNSRQDRHTEEVVFWLYLLLVFSPIHKLYKGFGWSFAYKFSLITIGSCKLVAKCYNFIFKKMTLIIHWDSLRDFKIDLKIPFPTFWRVLSFTRQSKSFSGTESHNDGHISKSWVSFGKQLLSQLWLNVIFAWRGQINSVLYVCLFFF